MTPYFTDMPATEDRLNFGRVVRQLLRDLRQGSVQGPLTIGVQGHWGQGKSSFLAMVEAEAARDTAIQAKYLFHAFAPWRFQKETHLLIPLLLSLAEEFPGQGIKESVRRVCASLVYLAGEAFLAGSTLNALNMGKVEKSLKTLEPKGRKSIQQARQAQSDFIQCRETLLEVFKKITNGGKMTLVILMDDLDRCHPPEVAVELLEQIHLFFAQHDMPVIFLLVVDPQALREVLEKRFGADKAQLYLEKFIQLPLHLPRTAPALMARRIGLEALGEHPFYARLTENPDFQNVLERLALHVYPTARQFKRFLNQLLFVHCAQCEQGTQSACDKEGCPSGRASSRQLLQLVRWLLYKDKAPALAEDPVQLFRVEQAIQGDEHKDALPAHEGIQYADLVAFLTSHMKAADAEGLASFLLATRKHAITRIQTIQDFMYSTPADSGDEPYRHYAMRDSIERAYCEGRLKGGLDRLVDIDLQHMHIPGGDLTNTVFENCDFTHSDLSEVDFTGSSFTRCTFNSSLLSGAQFLAGRETKVSITDCTFRDLIFEGVQFGSLEFHGCTFIMCKLKKLHLEGVAFTHCTFKECTIFSDTIEFQGDTTVKHTTLRSLLQAFEWNRGRNIPAGEPTFDQLIELLQGKHGALLNTESDVS